MTLTCLNIGEAISRDFCWYGVGGVLGFFLHIMFSWKLKKEKNLDFSSYNVTFAKSITINNIQLCLNWRNNICFTLTMRQIS